ncbi:apolipoprotein A1/A4/E family protein [Leptospira haakeii]|nr:apolipoprotein A1/A4/E family protein [Leptospira haakeii]
MFRRIPRKLEEVLGDQGANEFLDFINDSFAANKENIVELVSDRFEKRLSEEINVFRSEIKAEMADLRAEVKEDIANLRAELKEDLAEIRIEMKTEFAEIYKLIAAQTRWMLGAIVALTGIFSIIVKM